MVERMVARGYERDFAQRCFDQIKGFGSYGFPESHAASFAKLVYISSWLKCHHPAAFACALLNAQPMGFYAPAQIVREAQEVGGVEPRAIDVNSSFWDNGLEPIVKRSAVIPGDRRETRDPFRNRSGMDPGSPLRCVRDDGEGAGKPSPFALRLGFRQIDGFREEWGLRIAARRGGGYADVEELMRRADLPGRAMRLLADADAFRSLGLDRREALWAVRRLPDDEALPLFAAAQARELGEEPAVPLPVMPLPQQIVADYQTARLSLKGHPMGMLRPLFRRDNVLSCAELEGRPDGSWAATAGVVLVRQRPGNGKAIFITLEDETGIANILLWARLFERFRREVMSGRLLQIEGRVQKSPEGVVHLMAQRVVDRTADLASLSESHSATITLTRADEFKHPQAPRGRHPRDVRILPKSRDFH
jgi:error-prone DNA polymerase